MQKPQFGVSTRLYGGGHLGRDHWPAAAARESLVEIASYGFEIVELVEHPGHIEYGNPAAVAASNIGKQRRLPMVPPVRLIRNTCPNAGLPSQRSISFTAAGASS